MLISAWLVTCAALLGSSSSELVVLPTDVTSLGRGAAAVPYDAAAIGEADGFEVQLRQRTGVGQGIYGAWGVYGVIPIDGVTLAGGYEWQAIGQPASGSRFMLGTALQFFPHMYAGLAWRHWQAHARGPAFDSVDFGLFAELARYLSVSLGWDSLNEPAHGDRRVDRAWRVGVGVRPILGEPWLTLGLDSRFVGNTSDYALFDTRALLDVAPTEGVHVLVSYSRALRGEQQMWAGLGLDLLGLELQGVTRFSDATENPMSQAAFSETFRSHPTESVIPPLEHIIEVPLEGSLEEPTTGLFHPGKAIPTAALRLEELSHQRHVHHVVLNIGQLKVGLATVDGLRQAIAHLRQAGKTVTATLRGGDDKTYMVAAAADRVLLDPLTDLNVDGFALTQLFFADGLAQLGVHVEAIGVGKYKTGPDPLTRNGPRPEDREVENEILGQAQRSLEAVLTQDRKLRPEQVAAIMKQGMFTAQEALAAGLVDELSQSADATLPLKADLHGVGHDLETRPNRSWGIMPTLAVVPVVGTIVMTGSDNPLPGASAEAHAIVRQLAAAQTDPSVIGVVLRVDSPGGDAYASEVIWRAVRRLAAVKPVVTSMGDVAASGGYYIAAPTAAIFAQPNTVTGSIGIFTLKPDFSGIMGRFGVHSEIYKTAEHADWDSVTHPWREVDRGRLMHSLENFYEAFVARVALGRHLHIDRVRELAQGRVYTAQRAQELGLVDSMGDIADAVQWLKAQNGLDADAAVRLAVPDRALAWPQVLARMVQTDAPTLANLANDALQRMHSFSTRALAILPWTYEVTP